MNAGLHLAVLAVSLIPSHGSNLTIIQGAKTNLWFSLNIEQALEAQSKMRKESRVIKVANKKYSTPLMQEFSIK